MNWTRIQRVAALSILIGGFSVASQAAEPPAAGAPAASSARKDPKEEAMARFKRAVELYEEQDFRSALIEFKEAYRLAPTYKILFNIGQACYQLQDYVCALQSFESYLAQGKQEIPPARATQVQEDVGKLRSRIGRVEVNANVPNAQVYVDDILIGTTPLEGPIPVNMGRRKILVRREGRADFVQAIDIAGTAVTKVDAQLIELKGADRTTVITRDIGSMMTPWTWVGFGATAALAGGAVFFGVKANNTSDELKDVRFAGPTPNSAYDSKRDDAKSQALVSDIFAGAAVATLATTLILTFARNPKATTTETTTAPKVSVGPGSVMLQGAF